MAYAALTSLMGTVGKILQQNPDPEKGEEMKFLYETLGSLRAILEDSVKRSDLEMIKRLEAQTTQMAYALEDKVELAMESGILGSLNQIKGHIDSTMNDWMKIKTSYENHVKALPANEGFSPDSSKLSSQPENVMVGHNNELDLMLDHLTRGSRELKVVSIVGMGGIGKTTFATRIYYDPVIVSRFDTRPMVTVSQEFYVRRLLLGLLNSITSIPREICNESDGQLADRLRKGLKGRRYLIFIDDIWSTEAWDDMKLCFPDDGNGSRILLTTRNTEVAEYASMNEPPFHRMRLLSFDESWNLFHSKVFTKKGLSSEFEKIGKEVVKKCRGLPLTIIIVAGLLSKIHSLVEWGNVAEDVNSLLYECPDKQCSRLIDLSYRHLPHHIKACFLYFGVFQEDTEINVKRLVKLWVAEGFLEVEKDKNLEEVAKKCLEDLIDRSLVFADKGSTRNGKIKTCKMHDLLHGFCLREAQRENFLRVIQKKDDDLHAKPVLFHPKFHRRISILSCDNYKLYFDHDTYNKARSILFLGKPYYIPDIKLEYSCFKLLRVLDIATDTLRGNFPKDILCLFHLRYLAFTFAGSLDSPLDMSLWNLETFVFDYRVCGCIYFAEEIWRMEQLRHLKFSLNCLTQPSQEKCLVLENLQTFSGLNPLNCTKEVFKRIPNVKKLMILGHMVQYGESEMPDCFNDLASLGKLESLGFHIQTNINHLNLCLPPPGNFPQNLKKLTFIFTYMPWKNMDIVGMLPNLEVLKLRSSACIGEEWEPSENGFHQLKFLLLHCSDPNYWKATSDHFPLLEHLVLRDCYHLQEIPLDFADSLTLQSIEIENCERSVVTSAEQIQEEQRNLGVDDLIVRACRIRGCEDEDHISQSFGGS
ncbi:putative late blight resistance protein homolog R1B-16 [Nicotiana tabacum]|uniref:Late blight resistance protein homolog R1B-16 n=1 Tax=Nicotiana tabacum TaxID=4097 RepID=A0A1S3ZWG9_TOBAC|nr:PREDICTED: putative late blight resistance protein homolog R1B-16 [Nicotiana tabacum]XP_016468677.1 PREDICTED: putative late blight resistance protein homolog R1B-16 [Nicotiana tabacum]XP_016468678.1 PREDICTED: putative late blight resistance protein homolog R1B-16 [Nicotiana tabacum]XP_016468679.1 PREDICTED: putative late blight resistance protein homolog R1B-16 [Nicotiana tabacum]